MTSILIGLVTGSGLASPGAAAAATIPGRLEPGVTISGVTARGTSWLGAMVPPLGYEDDVAFCITAGGDVPMGTTPVGVDAVPDPQLAAVMGAHRWEGDTVTRAAISFLSHLRWETGANGVSAQTRKERYLTQTPQDVQDRASALLAEAAGVAGPYAAATVSTTGAATRTGDIHNVGVTSASGGWVAGLPFTATLSGPAVFDATGSSTLSGTTAASPLTLRWTATGTGTVGFSVTYGDVPRVTLTKLQGAGTVQTVITYGHRPAGADPLERVSPPVTFDVVGQFQPTASTVVGSKTVAQGDALVDRVTVGTALGDGWLTAG